MSGLPASTCDKPSSLAYQDGKQLQDENHIIVGKWRHKKQVSFQQKAQVNANMHLVSNKSSTQSFIPCIFAFLLFDFHFFSVYRLVVLWASLLPLVSSLESCSSLTVLLWQSSMRSYVAGPVIGIMVTITTDIVTQAVTDTQLQLGLV